jgi:predicted CopG family antitoxin
MSKSEAIRNDATTVRIRNDTWKRLNARKEQGDTFDDVLNRLLDETKGNSDVEVSTE